MDNYIAFRVIIITVLILLTYIIFKFVKNFYIKKYYFIFEVIGFIFICIYPIENNLFKFNSIEEAFNYYYFPSGTIIKKYEYDNYAYIVYDDYKTDVPGLMYFTKKNDNWHINNLITKGMANDKMITYFWISVIEIPNMNSAAIAVYYKPFSKNENVKITDSLSSNFETFRRENDDNDVYVAIINEKVNSDYTLYVNGKEYKPFKK